MAIFLVKKYCKFKDDRYTIGGTGHMKLILITLKTRFVRFSERLARFQSQVLLTVVYFLGFTPIALFRKKMTKGSRITTSWQPVSTEHISLTQLEKQA